MRKDTITSFIVWRNRKFDETNVQKYVQINILFRQNTFCVSLTLKLIICSSLMKVFSFFVFIVLNAKYPVSCQ
jgi:hypothetical protein